MFFSAVKLGILTWGVYGTDSLLEPASSGQSMNCSFSHVRVGFTRESGRLPLGSNLGRSCQKHHSTRFTICATGADGSQSFCIVLTHSPLVGGVTVNRPFVVVILDCVCNILSPSAALESPSEVSVFDTHTSHTLTVTRTVSCVRSSTDPEDDAPDRQRSKSLPSAAPANHVSWSLLLLA